MNEEPQTGEIWRHKENGNEYLIILIANKASAKWEDRAVFVSRETGEPYDRPLSEFMEKFEHICKRGCFRIQPNNLIKVDIFNE